MSPSNTASAILVASVEQSSLTHLYTSQTFVKVPAPPEAPYTLVNLLKFNLD